MTETVKSGFLGLKSAKNRAKQAEDNPFFGKAGRIHPIHTGEYTRLHGRIHPSSWENSPFYPTSGLFYQIAPETSGRIHPYLPLSLCLMPYLHDPRRTVTLNLHPQEYDALAQDALEAGYPTPGTYAKALVEARGDAPAPRQDQRSQERYERLQAQHTYLLEQFEAAQRQLRAAGHAFVFADLPLGVSYPRTRAAQDRALKRAAQEAVQAERARRAARQAARAAAPLASPLPEPTPTRQVVPGMAAPRSAGNPPSEPTEPKALGNERP